MLTETQKVEMWSDFKTQSVHELVRLSGELFDLFNLNLTKIN